MSQIDYSDLVAGALRGIMREALAEVARDGLPGNHHFYITFRTGHPDVRIAGPLAATHPDDMTIVLQHRFWGLTVEEDAFEVTLSFSGRNELLRIPFEAVTVFTDPSVGFCLRFGEEETADAADGDDAPAPESGPEPDAEPAAGATGDVVALDAFRVRKKN